MHALEALQRGQIGLQPLGLDQGLTRQVEQAVETVGSDPQHPLATFAGALAGLAWRRGLWIGFRFADLCGNRQGRRLHGDLRHWRRRRYLQKRCRRCTRVQQVGQLRQKCRYRRRAVGIPRGGDAHQQIGALQQGIDVLGAQQQTALLGGDQAIFHDMSDADARIDTHDPRRPLQGMGRAHTGFQLVGLGRVAFQRHQPGVQYLGLRLGLQAEQLEQRCIAHLLWGHVRLRCTADSRC
ncbi:hypothetical protein D3C76_597010 [compost metagenome]